MRVTIKNYRHIFYDILHFMKNNNLTPDSYVTIRREPDETKCYRRIVSIGLEPQDGLESYTVSSIISEVIGCFLLNRFKYHDPTDFKEFITLLGFSLDAFQESFWDNNPPTDIQIAIEMYDDYRDGTLLFNKLMIIDSSWLFEDEDNFDTIIDKLVEEMESPSFHPS